MLDETLIMVVINRVTTLPTEMSCSHQFWTEQHARLV
jgi:hypothetical protein